MNLTQYHINKLNIKKETKLYKITMTILMACFTGILAQIVIPLPFTPVPITCQTIGVLTAGLILGKKYGALSQILYILLGISILPWFNNMTGGINVLLGANGGYLIGFVLAAYFVGYFSRKNNNIAITSSIATFGLIYIPGLISLTLFNYLNQGILLTIPQLLIIGFIPFIIGDIIKILITSRIFKTLISK